jgi:hypothetical protein
MKYLLYPFFQLTQYLDCRLNVYMDLSPESNAFP